MKVPGNPYIPINAIVRSLVRENLDTVSFDLECNDVDLGKLCAPGQFNMLYSFGKGEVPISFSRITNGKGVTHTVRSVGKVSKALCDLRAGAQVSFRGPFGRGWPIDIAKGKDLVVVAGGIGLAPLRPVVEAAVTNRQLFGNITLIYGARNPREIIFKADLEKWRSELNVHVTVDTADGSWTENIGLVTPLVNRLRINPDTTVAMLCGPEIMMDFCAHALMQKGVKDRDIYVSMERNMKCAIGHCGHCQFGGDFICKSGPVFALADVAERMAVKEY
jgi:NAD(P)H-flavin reductase